MLLVYSSKGGSISEQLHKRFTDDQVRLLLDLYTGGVISLVQVLQQLGCSRSRFYQLLKRYRDVPEEFTIAYARHKPQHRLSTRIDCVIREEQEKDKQLISDPQKGNWERCPLLRHGDKVTPGMGARENR